MQPWQADFAAASFCQSDSARFHILEARPGTGKTYTSARIVAELVARGAKRILILAPSTLCEAWIEEVQRSEAKMPASYVTRHTYREMIADTPVGESPWDKRGIFAMSLDFASRTDDVVDGLQKAQWDLLLIDGGHHLTGPRRREVVVRLLPVVSRLLILAADVKPLLTHVPTGEHSEPAGGGSN